MSADEPARRDSTGGCGVLQQRGALRERSGSDGAHSRCDGLGEEPVDVLLGWTPPGRRDHFPSYAQRASPEPARRTRLAVASPDGAGGCTTHRDEWVSATLLDEVEVFRPALTPGRAWVQVASGGVALDGEGSGTWDGASGLPAPELSVVADAGKAGAPYSDIRW